MAELVIIIKNFIPELFSLLFQQGVTLKVKTGVTVREFLCSTLGLSPEYVENRISTIFLNGKPVDDLDSSHINNNSTISLSAAMPGLVGATMRRAGFYASFRNSITYKDEGAGSMVDGIVRIKLFNIIMKEIGADLLRMGIYVSYEDIELLIKNNAKDFIKNCINATLDGKEINCEKLNEYSSLHGYENILLKLVTDY